MTQVNSTNSTQGTGNDWDSGQNQDQTQNEAQQNTQNQEGTNAEQSAQDAEQAYKESIEQTKADAKDNSTGTNTAQDTPDDVDVPDYNSSQFQTEDGSDDYQMQNMDMDPDMAQELDDMEQSFAEKYLQQLNQSKEPQQLKNIMQDALALDVEDAVDESLKNLAEQADQAEETTEQQQKTLKKLAKQKGSEKLFTQKQISQLINKSKKSAQKQLAALENEIKEEFTKNKSSKKLNTLMKDKERVQKFLKEDITKLKKQAAQLKGQKLTQKGLKSKSDGFGKQSFADTMKSKFKGLFKNDKMSTFNKMSAQSGKQAGPLTKEEKQKYEKQFAKQSLDNNPELTENERKQQLANMKSVKDLAKEQALKQAKDPAATEIQKQGEAYVLANLKTYEGKLTKKDGTKWSNKDTEAAMARMCGDKMEAGAMSVDTDAVPTERAFMYAVSAVHKRVRDGEDGEPSEAVAFLQGAFQSAIKGTFRVDGTSGRIGKVYNGQSTIRSKGVSKDELIESKHKSLSGLAKIDGTYSDDFVGDFDQQYEEGDISGADARNRDIDNVKV